MKVIKEIAGPNTGDTLVITEDGTCWKVVDSFSERATGDRQGYIIDGEVKEI